MTLSDAQCLDAEPKKSVYKLSDGSGLCLRVVHTGGKYWVFRYRWEGKEKNLSLGVFPRASLAEARAVAALAKRQVKYGIDPALQKFAEPMVPEVGDEASFGKRTPMALTDAACRSAKLKKTRYKLSAGGGLCLSVIPEGGKYWALRYRFGGKEKNLSLGAYPAVSLAEALEKRDEAKKLLKKGVDPGLERIARKLKSKTSEDDSFEVVAREWIDLKRKTLAPRYIAQIQRCLEGDIFPHIGRLPCRRITTPMMLGVLKKVQARGVLETMLRLKEYCGSIFRYAIICEKADRDPSADLRDALPSPKKQHFAAIDVADLPDRLLKMKDNTISIGTQTRFAMRALLLTFVRTKELIGARKEEFNFELARWVIPAERMKMKRDHIVPLSRQAMELFKSLSQISSGDYIFTGQHSWLKPMSNMAILMGLKRMGYKGKMTGHGFRALAMTALREILDFPKDVIDLQLAHAKGKVDAAYDRAKFLKERTAMMQRWADYIDEMEKIAQEKQKSA